MSEKYYAHSLKEKPKGEWHPLDKHLKDTANKAEAFAEDFGAGKWAYLAGLWHDIGKYSREFQERIGVKKDANAHIEKAGKPDHSTAGAKHANRVLEQYGKGKLLAYAIAGHHTGIPDGKALPERLKKKIPDHSACPEEILNAPDPGTLPLKPENDRLGFQLTFFIRMLYSCLVDADFLNTEKFFDKEKADWRKGYPELTKLPEKLDSHLEKKASAEGISKHRSDILQYCLDAAEMSPGLFSLTVPTGGGKTLSSLAFALKHALKYGMKRIIYVIPYTSIIEQNAAVFRKALGENAVLEHHSNFEPTKEDRRSRLASENWDAPLVVTTNVQFFESLFRRKSSKCRKIHHIAKSVIILDEAQMLPVPLLRPCTEVLKELSASYGTSIVLCTATQPAWDFKGGLEEVREIIPDPQKLYETFRKMKGLEVENLGEISDEELADRLCEEDKVLCIVNTRGHARTIYEKIKEHKKEGLYHLSARMCPVHRSKKLDEIRKALKGKRVCRVVSTQLVEAGVDVDFPSVFRSLAGIDSIAQAAGRCNREGKPEGGRLRIFSTASGLPRHFEQNARVAEMVMQDHHDPLALDAIRQYFGDLIWVKGDAGLDKYGILEALEDGVGELNFSFEEADRKFKIIEDRMRPIIIPYDEEAGKQIRMLRQSEYPLSIARKLQKFTVQIYPHEFDRLSDGRHLESLHDGQYHALNDMGLYQDDIGLCVG